jgi:transketolase
MTANERRTVAAAVRRFVLQRSRTANVGHIGSSLSIADILVALYTGPLATDAHEDPDRDRFLLSKGHAALALYCTLHATGRLTRDELETFCTDGSLLGVHPEHALRGIDFSSGSLGQGLSVGSGAALAARMEHSRRRVFVLMSDAECNEGSVWEAVMFAAHRRLGNLVAIIDLNGQQAFGYTRDVLSLDPLAEKWRAFGWDVHEVDGHDHDGMIRTIEGLHDEGDTPHVLIARTVFGRGVSYMEGTIDWHYLPMSESQYEQALAEVGTPT